MAYRLPSERVVVACDGPYDGLTIEVRRIGPVGLQTAAALVGAFLRAEGVAAEIRAMRELFGYFVVMAQPTWSIIDDFGVVPPTEEGLARLDPDLAFLLIGLWRDTAAVSGQEAATAVDALIPPGELRDELNARLRAVA